MKFRKEDRLAKLAFGDLNEQEAQELELLVKSDPRMEKTLMEYRSMRDGLRQLADIPEHQLSNERLRDAILGNGLNPKAPVKFDWGWIATSALACFIVAGVVGLRGRLQHNVDPQFVTGSSSVAVNSPTDTSLNVFGSSKHSVKVAKVVAPVHHETASGGALVASYEAPVRHRRRHEPTLDAGAGDLMASLTKQPAIQPAVLTKTPDENASTTPTPAPDTSGLKPVDDTPTSSVVVIDQEKDQETGAQRATELGSPTNVVVGG
jgi:anti-sigma factor RsiW